jgi:hypothetical protein
MAVQIQVRRGAASDWTSANPTLAAGEIGFETDTGYLKIGNGSTAWTALAYAVRPINAYTGHIETAADKTYTIDPAAATARTITGFRITSGSGTCTATLKIGSDTVKAASVSTSSGDQTSLANTDVAVNEAVTIVVSSNSSATDVVFSVEYTE